jgi:diaminopimelate decarboxylase
MKRSPSTRPRPVADELLRALAERHGTPLYVYDAATLLARANELLRARASDGRGFDVVRYAQKANPNLALLALLREAGVLVDAVSAGELRRSLLAGFEPRRTQFCADLFDRETLGLLGAHPFAVNVGSPDMLEQLASQRGATRKIALRINPGFGHGHDAKVSTGGSASKHGIWHADAPHVVARARACGLEVTGLHVHIGSGSDLENLTRSGAALEAAARVVGSTLESISAGGGLPIPYRPGEERFEVAAHVEFWCAVRARIERDLGRRIALEVEPGRYLVAECGVLVCEVRGLKRNGEHEYILVDAGFHNLIRPAMYGAHHEISILGRDGAAREPFLVAGPLCESADVFTQGKQGAPLPRELPRPAIGDLVCLHDAGAYGAAMASGYNSQLLAAEVLVHNGAGRLVRARQTFEQLVEPELECKE